MLTHAQITQKATSGGVLSGISGGDFGRGFIGGALNNISASLAQGMSSVGNFGAVEQHLAYAGAAAVSAKLQGGNFWQSAGQALTVVLLNHGVHTILDKERFEITEEAIEPLIVELEFDIMPSGRIRFEGLQSRHLNQFRVIPEVARAPNDLILPQNDRTYETDGFYYQSNTKEKYWYKIGGGRSVTVRYIGKNFELSKSLYNPLGIFSFIGWKPKSEPHWTINPF